MGLGVPRSAFGDLRVGFLPLETGRRPTGLLWRFYSHLDRIGAAGGPAGAVAAKF